MATASFALVKRTSIRSRRTETPAGRRASRPWRASTGTGTRIPVRRAWRSSVSTRSRRASSPRKVACFWSRPELAEERGAGEGADGAGALGPEGPHQGGRPGARDAEERFEVAAGEQGPVERVELRDGVGEGEEPPGVRTGTLRTGQPVATVGVGRMARRHVFNEVSRRSSRMQARRRHGIRGT